jgi:hypothetical protein
MDDTSIRRTRRSAWVAAAVSVVVDVVVVIRSAGADVYYCPDGWSTLGGTFRHDLVVVAVVAALAIGWSIRSIYQRPPSGRGRADLATAVILVAAATCTLASWIILHHRPDRGCFD